MAASAHVKKSSVLSGSDKKLMVRVRGPFRDSSAGRQLAGCFCKARWAGRRAWGHCGHCGQCGHCGPAAGGFPLCLLRPHSVMLFAGAAWAVQSRCPADKNLSSALIRSAHHHSWRHPWLLSSFHQKCNVRGRLRLCVKNERYKCRLTNH